MALAAPEKPVTFTEVTQPAGLTFRHTNAASSRKYIIETMGSGGAWLDFDQDGWLDLFLVNGGSTPALKLKAAPKHALFRNLRDGKFAGVTGGRSRWQRLVRDGCCRGRL